MAVSKTDLKFFLTGLQPGTTGTPSQSLGGYMTTTEISPSVLLSALLTQDSSNIALSSSVAAGRLLIGNEILTQSGGTGGAISLRGGLTTTSVPHASGLSAYQVSTPLFDNTFANDGTQYRCVAVNNVNSSSTFFALNFYIKAISLNSNLVKMAVEAPKTVGKSGVVTSSTTLSITVSALAGLYVDDYLKGCAVKFTSGTNSGVIRVVQSFTGASGVLVFTSQLPLVSGSGDTFYVYPAPSQSIASGTVSPIVGNSNATGWITPSAASMQSIDVGGYRTSQGLVGANLLPNEVMYLWFQRTTASNAPAFAGNRVIFTANYKTQ